MPLQALWHLGVVPVNGHDWDDCTQPLDIVKLPDPLPATHERAAWLSRLMRALERPTVELRKPVVP